MYSGSLPDTFMERFASIYLWGTMNTFTSCIAAGATESGFLFQGLIGFHFNHLQSRYGYHPLFHMKPLVPLVKIWTQANYCWILLAVYRQPHISDTGGNKSSRTGALKGAFPGIKGSTAMASVARPAIKSSPR